MTLLPDDDSIMAIAARCSAAEPNENCEVGTELGSDDRRLPHCRSVLLAESLARVPRQKE